MLLTLKEIRKSSGLKTKKIAELLSISSRQYYNIEKGKSKLDDIKIEKLAKIFSLPKSQIKKCWEEGITNEQTN